MTRLPVRRAFISVWDKTGLEELGTRLVRAGAELVSSGGTARALAAAGLPVVQAAEVTGAPEILGGRVKTLHHRIYGGVLADPERPEHRRDLESQRIEPFQLVVVGFYPFEEAAAARPGEEEGVIEMIDVGGPAILRAAAKNHAWVGAVSAVDQYERVAEEVEAGGLTAELRRWLAEEVFYRTAAYDAAILAWLERDGLPRHLVLPMERAMELRYGENPHQPAAAYRRHGVTGWWSAARLLQGKELSFNNLLDAEAAWRLVTDLDHPAAAVIKHANPSGAAQAPTLPEAYRSARDGDPVSAFGGVVALSEEVDGETAGEMASLFLEVAVAPAFSEEARQALAAKPSLRLLEAPPPGDPGWDLRAVDHGLLAQAPDRLEDEAAEWKVVAGGLDDRLRADLAFAWRVAAHARSNAVVVARNGATVGIGAGDTSRVGAAGRAVAAAGDRAVGAVAAGDAFFPFRDGLDVLADAGVAAVVAPGGSRNDEEVVAAAEERGITLVFAGRRHFRH